MNANDTLPLSGKAYARVTAAEARLAPVFARLDAIEEANLARVLYAFSAEGVALRHFTPTTGYGYDDAGRDTLDKVFARALGAEDALARPQLTSGTHALYTALSGLTEPGDAILSATGKPYDTLEGAIGLSGDHPCSLARMGVSFHCVELDKHGKPDVPAILAGMEQHNASVVYVQRSRGYAWRDSLLPERDMQPLFAAVRERFPNAIIMVDNCYGEFTDTVEPVAVGADVLAGSLIKNPGGGLAPTGGYIAGRADLVERVAQRLTVPGMGREVGSYAGSYRPFYQGLFMAPHTTVQAMKCAALFAELFQSLSLPTMPAPDAKRSDIVQAVRFPTAEALIAFCQSIQKASPVDSFAVPEPWDMPGYSSKVIMAAGAFVQGASIELSADAPLRPPYTAYIQGGLTFAHGKLAAAMALDALNKAGEITL